MIENGAKIEPNGEPKSRIMLTNTCKKKDAELSYEKGAHVVSVLGKLGVPF